MKRGTRRVDWRSRPAKRRIQATRVVSFRIGLEDIADVDRILRGASLFKVDPHSLDEVTAEVCKAFGMPEGIIFSSAPMHHSVAVLGRARVHVLSATDNREIPYDALRDRSKFLFREAGVKVEE